MKSTRIIQQTVALAAIAVLAWAAPAHAALSTSHTSAGDGATVDGVLSADEYGTGNANVYAGGGLGFGGTLGNGTIYMDTDATNLYIGYQPGANLNDDVAIYLNTEAGGFGDDDMNDQADGGRSILSNLTRDVSDAFPASMSSLPDYGIVMANWGIVSFVLNAGSTNGHLQFDLFDGAITGANTNFREFSVPLANLDIGPGGTVEFFAAYCAESMWNSNESIPPSAALNAGSNPGQAGPAPGYDDHDALLIPPEPEIDVAPTALDFSGVNSFDVVAPTTRTLDVVVDNLGTAALNISDLTITGSPDFTVAPPAPLVVNAGTSTSLTVSFYATSGLGTYNGELVITSDDTSETTVGVLLSGEAVPVELSDLKIE